MNVEEILKELQALGSEQTKKIFARHGAMEPFFGVKVEYLKKIQGRIKKDYQLSLDLYDTGNSDAMYLAGLIADEDKMTQKDLNTWVQKAYWYMLSEYTVAKVAAESSYGWQLAKEWIRSDKEMIAAAGWSTLSNLIAIEPDEQLDSDFLKASLDTIHNTIHQAPNRVRYTMNGFLIALGSYVPAFTQDVYQAGGKIGKVAVDMGGTSCKVPDIVSYVKKIEDKGLIGKKRKNAR